MLTIKQIVYAAINAAIVPTLYFLFPETAHLSLEELDEVFLRSQSWLDPPKIARKMLKDRAHGGDVTTKDEKHDGLT